MTPGERECRRDLAAAYRLMDHFGVRDLTYNHLSARIPDDPASFLIKPSDFMFWEVTASTLSKYSLDGTAIENSQVNLSGGALVIHAGLMARRPDVGAVFHTHTVANMAVAAQKAGLLPITQQALLFFERISYHDFEGFEFEAGMEDKLDTSLGRNQVAILRNHGLLVTGSTVAEAFVLHHFFEIAAQAQVAALAGGSEVTIPNAAVCKEAAATMEKIGATKNGGKNWAACLRLADALFPGYAT